MDVVTRRCGGKAVILLFEDECDLVEYSGSGRGFQTNNILYTSYSVRIMRLLDLVLRLLALRLITSVAQTHFSHMSR